MGELARTRDDLPSRLKDVERENRQLREALCLAEDARARYAELYDSAPVACCTLDLHGRIEALNRTCATLFGRDRSEVLGLPFSTLVAFEQPDALFAHLRLCQSTGRAIVSELAFTTADSARVDVQVISVPVAEASGRPSAFRTAIIDICERKRVEAERNAAFQAEQRLRNQLETVGRAAVAVSKALAHSPTLSTSDVLRVVVDEVRMLVSARGAAFLLADAPDTWVLSRLSPTADAAALERMRSMTVPVLERDLLGVRVAFAERTLGHLFVLEKAGTRPFAPDDRLVLEELAERVGISLQISRLNQSAHDAIRSRDTLLAVVAHDLRSPLSAISVSSAMLARAPGEQGERRRGQKQVAIIKKATQHMDRLIEDLLTASTIEAGRFTVCLHPEPPASIVREAVELLEPVAAANRVALEHHAAADLPAVLCDRARVIQVLNNLVQNAVKFTPSGGHVRLWAASEEGAVRWSVSDDGPGIPPAKLPHVFDRYWKGEATGRQGVGLGLYISRGIVESHGSKIHVETAVGRGTTFSFTLPLAPRFT